MINFHLPKLLLVKQLQQLLLTVLLRWVIARHPRAIIVYALMTTLGLELHFEVRE